MEKKTNFQVIIITKEREKFIFNYNKLKNIKLLKIIFSEINFFLQKKIKISFLSIPSEILLKILEFSFNDNIFKNEEENLSKEKNFFKNLWKKEFFKIDHSQLYGIILASSFLGEEHLFQISISLISKVMIRKSFLKLKKIKYLFK